MENKKNIDFEKNLKEVEKIISDIENNKISINDLLKKYNEGKTLIEDLNIFLDQIEKKVNSSDDE